jgi:beta-glucuronidase
MVKLRLAAVLVVAALLGVAAPADSQAPGAYVPPRKALYDNGPSGRYLLGGTWLSRVDTRGVGLAQRWQASTSSAGWSPVTVPNAWNLNDHSSQSFVGSVAWYRKDFKLPSDAVGLSWIVRFESVNYRSRVWLNGHPLGSHSGAYLPFELRLPASYLDRDGINHLVVRVDNRRRPTDFPPSGLSTNGVPTGGWWNYGGLLREVYLREVDRVDFNTVRVLPSLPCATCAAKVRLRVTMRGYGPGPQRLHVSGTFGDRAVDLGTAIVAPGAFATFTKTLTIPDPRLWTPQSPNLYDLRLTARVGDREAEVQSYFSRTGIRSIKVVGGRLTLNGRPLSFRGVGLQEDSLLKGSALSNRDRAKLIDETKRLGATLIRSHYPLHPQLEELADENGIMLWSEIPVYSIKTQYLKSKTVRTLAANELRENILDNGNHPSIVVWSIGNELSSRPGTVQSYYISRAVRAAHELDPTRPVGLAVAAYPTVGCRPQYAPLDVIGFNDYFGWYPGPNGSIADRTLLSGYLDSIRKCYPGKALAITETGAEANRHGPVEEKGTYEFQSDYAAYQMKVFASKPWLSGAVWWTLQDFRVRPGWDGGNPRPDPPIFNKGLIDMDGHAKPAFGTLQRIYHATKQLGDAPAKR